MIVVMMVGDECDGHVHDSYGVYDDDNACDAEDVLRSNAHDDANEVLVLNILLLLIHDA